MSKNNTNPIQVSISQSDTAAPSTKNEKDELKTKSELSPRKKVILGRGYSLMDWIRVTKTTPDLAGNNGILKRVTLEELAQHNREDDCWMAIFDKVYNVTPYLKFHPGGVDELMKGAGINATKIFNDVHPWVNLQNMLEKCLVGILVSGSNSPDSKSKAKSPQKTLNINTKVNAQSVESPTQQKNKFPELDFYQTNETTNVILYTKWKQMKPDYIIVDKFETDTGNYVDIFAYILNDVFKYTIDMLDAIKNDIDVRVSREGKVEVTFYKLESIYWSKMNPKLNYSCEPVFYTQSGVNFRQCELIKRERVTHDTDIYTFEWPRTTKLSVPLGYHVFLRLLNEKYLVKPYTVIDESFEIEKSNVNQRHLHLMIKHYDDGQFTSKLQNLSLNSIIEVSNFTGNFEHEKLSYCTELVLICAGTGFTPMIRLINFALKINSISQIKLLFFNKKSIDILWKANLDELKAKYANKISLVYILSDAETEWNGPRGRISKELLNEFVFESTLQKPLFFVCGPKAFSDLTLKFLHGFNIRDDSIHLFSS